MKLEDYSIQEIRLLEDMLTRMGGNPAILSKSEREYRDGYYMALAKVGQTPPPEIYEPTN